MRILEVLHKRMYKASSKKVPRFTGLILSPKILR